MLEEYSNRIWYTLYMTQYIVFDNIITKYDILLIKYLKPLGFIYIRNIIDNLKEINYSDRRAYQKQSFLY